MQRFDEWEEMITHRPPLEPLKEPSGAPGEVVAACIGLLASYGPVPAWSIGVTSSVRGEGRTTIAAALAWLMRSEYGRPTIRLDLDPHEGSTGGEKPMAEVLRGDSGPLEAVAWLAPGYGLLALSAATEQVAIPLARLRSSSIVADLQSEGYAVVADLPPLLPAGNADRVAHLFSSIAMVIRAGATPSHRVQEAVRLLPESPKVILNGVGSSVPRWLRFVGGR